MEQKLLIVVSVISARNFPRRAEYSLVVEAQFNKEVLSADPVPHVGNTIPINNELAWEVTKKAHQQHKLNRTPIKLQCFAVNKVTMVKENVGYVMLDIKTARKSSEQEPAWHVVLNSPYSKFKPQLFISLSLELEDTRQSSQVKGHMMNAEAGLDLTLDPGGRFYQLGVGGQEMFTLSLTIRNPKQLPPLPPGQTCYHFYYNLLGNDITSESFTPPTFQPERASIRIQSNRISLALFMAAQQDMQIHLCCGSKSVGKGTLSLAPLKTVDKLDCTLPLGTGNSSISVSLQLEKTQPSQKPQSLQWSSHGQSSSGKGARSDLTPPVPTAKRNLTPSFEEASLHVSSNSSATVDGKSPQPASPLTPSPPPQAPPPTGKSTDSPKGRKSEDMNGVSTIDNFPAASFPRTAPATGELGSSTSENRHYKFSIDLRSLQNLVLQPGTKCYLRYNYPFFGCPYPVLVQPPATVVLGQDLRFTQSFCSFDFATSHEQLLQQTLHSPLTVEVWQSCGNTYQIVGLSQITLSKIFSEEKAILEGDGGSFSRQICLLQSHVLSISSSSTSSLSSSSSLGQLNVVLVLEDFGPITLGETIPVCKPTVTPDFGPVNLGAYKPSTSLGIATSKSDIDLTGNYQHSSGLTSDHVTEASNRMTRSSIGTTASKPGAKASLTTDHMTEASSHMTNSIGVVTSKSDIDLTGHVRNKMKGTDVTETLGHMTNSFVGVATSKSDIDLTSHTRNASGQTSHTRNASDIDPTGRKASGHVTETLSHMTNSFVGVATSKSDIDLTSHTRNASGHMMGHVTETSSHVARPPIMVSSLGPDQHRRKSSDHMTKTSDHVTTHMTKPSMGVADINSTGKTLKDSSEYAVAMELEMWKLAEEEAFQEHLKNRESAHMTQLGEEWRRRESLRQELLRQKLEHYSSLENQLQEGLEKLKEQQKSLQVRELKVSQEKAKLNHDHISLTESHERTISSMKLQHQQQLEMERMKSSELQRQVDTLKRQVHDSDVRLRAREAEFEKYRQEVILRPESKLQAELGIAQLEKAELERKVAFLTKSKQHYKDQWSQALASLADCRQKEQSATRDKLLTQQQELEAMRAQFYQQEQQSSLKQQLSEVKKDVDRLQEETLKTSPHEQQRQVTPAKSPLPTGRHTPHAKSPKRTSPVPTGHYGPRAKSPQRTSPLPTGYHGPHTKSPGHNAPHSPVSKENQALSADMTRWIEERDILLQTGVYTSTDPTIQKLDHKIRSAMTRLKEL